MLRENIRKPDIVFEPVTNLTLVNLRYCVLILTQLPYIAYALSRSLLIGYEPGFCLGLVVELGRVD
jgi:hypothetical protein